MQLLSILFVSVATREVLRDPAGRSFESLVCGTDVAKESLLVLPAPVRLMAVTGANLRRLTAALGVLALYTC